MKNKNSIIFDTPEPISILNDWAKLAGQYDLVLGYSLFGDVFLMNSSTDRIALLYIMPPELVETQFFGLESFDRDCINHPVIREDFLSENKAQKVTERLGCLEEGQVFIPEPYPFLGGDMSVDSYSKGDLLTFLSIIEQLQNQ